jgi:hypothetical protein
MSVRVGHIMRHEDVHGVSGTGKVADVFEATNGKCMVVWISAHASVNVYDHIKDVETTHSHGGKTLVVWDYESPPDPDPMDKILNADKPELTDAEVEQIADETAAEVSQIAAAKVADLIAEKVAEQKDDNGVGPVKEEPKGSTKNGKKKAPAKKASAKKKE